MALSSPRLGLYVHWPFCKAKCPYCDFNSHVRAGVDHGAWANALCAELRWVAGEMGSGGSEGSRGRPLQSVFFGGGTPSLMEPSTVAAILAEAERLFGFASNIEITLEANPTSSEFSKFQDFKEAGINRISLGLQALNAPDLQFLGREHSATEAIAALEAATRVFGRVSGDLIFGRPNQTVKAWEAELEQAISLGTNHLSLYQLTIEEGTPFFARHARGEFALLSDDIQADMLDVTRSITAKHGMQAYEVSNYARLGEESRHNLIYWQYQDYIGIGPGAHGRVSKDGRKYATRAHRAPEIWLERVQQSGHGYHPFENVSEADQIKEILMMGLRLEQGIDITPQGHGVLLQPFLNQDTVSGRIKTLVDNGLLTLTGINLTATFEGRKRLNAVLEFLLLKS